ncbi:MAG: hypothetical protein WBZ29_16900 [Methanocella sp.]
MKLYYYVIVIVCIMMTVVILFLNVYDTFKSNNINTGKLYGTKDFSWYEYNVSYVYLSDKPVIAEHYRYEWQNESYGGQILPHFKASFTQICSDGNNFTHIDEIFWRPDGIEVMVVLSQDIENGSLIKNVTDNSITSTYQKFIPNLPQNSNIQTKGAEVAVINSSVYYCDRYYLPSHTDNGKLIIDDITYWFNASIPVPVKIYYACDNTTYVLIGWG